MKPSPSFIAETRFGETRFNGVAYALAVSVLGAVFAVSAWFIFGRLAPEQINENLLYACALGGFLAAGFAAGWSGRRLAFWELLAATVTLLAALLLFGHFGLTLNPLAPRHLGDEVEITKAMASAPGAAYLGPIWVRDLAVLHFIGLLQALTASSIAYMLRAKGFAAEPWFGFELFVSRRYLLAKRRDARVSRTASIAALGVCFGVAALISVVSAMSGYQAEVRDRILDTNAHLVVQRWGADFDNYGEVEEKLGAMPEVVATSPFVFTGGMIVTELGTFPALVKGVDPQKAGGVSRLRPQLRGTELGVLAPPATGQLPKIIVGVEMMKNLGLAPGQEISLVSPVPGEGQRGGPPKRMRFILAGHFSSGMNEFDQKLVYVGLEAAQAFVGSAQGVTGIEVKVRDPDRVEDVAKKAVQALGGWPYRTIDWRQMNRGIFSALVMQKLMMTIILVFIIVVAAFNIASTLFMLVVEKTREIAVLKALGAKDGMVMKIFVLEGHLIGLVGIASGIALGLVMCLVLGHLKIHIAADVYLVDTLRVVVRPSEIAMIALGAFEVAHLATLYPALRAARTFPVEAMRYG